MNIPIIPSSMRIQTRQYDTETLKMKIKSTKLNETHHFVFVLGLQRYAAIFGETSLNKVTTQNTCISTCHTQQTCQEKKIRSNNEGQWSGLMVTTRVTLDIIIIIISCS